MCRSCSSFVKTGQHVESRVFETRTGRAGRGEVEETVDDINVITAHGGL